MSELRFAGDRPKECRYCYFWLGKRKGCGLGGEANCYYRLLPSEQPVSDCDSCPYRQEPRCVSFCMKKVLEEWKAEREAVAKDGV